MTLRVAINSTPLLTPRTGIGNYIAELGAALAARGDVDLFSFYAYRWRHEAPGTPTFARRSRVLRSVRKVVMPLVPLKRHLWHAQQQLFFARGLRKHCVQVYHEPNYVPIRYDIPVVVTVHDLSWVHYPEAHPRDRLRWLERGLPRALERAAAILVDSDFVADELTTTFSVSRERVCVAPLGVSPAFGPRNTAQTRSTLQPLGLTHDSYVLSVGTIEPRKNLEHVLRAFSLMPQSLQRRFPLVIAGAQGWKADRFERELRAMASRGAVRFLGHVSDSDLVNLYAGAALFVFPSLYEGFGLPPLEAMACGAPVLVSARGSLPEVVGDAGMMLDPMDPAATAREIARLLDDRHFREECARRSLERASLFTWTDCAARTAAVLQAAAMSP